MLVKWEPGAAFDSRQSDCLWRYKLEQYSNPQSLNMTDIDDGYHIYTFVATKTTINTNSNPTVISAPIQFQALSKAAVQNKALLKAQFYLHSI